MTEPAPPGGTAIPWDELQAAARAMADRAYAPYSTVRVGAAALVDDGRLVSGCNVENASFGLTVCAEGGVAMDLAATGGGRLVALAVVGADGAYLPPCGRCRQVLYEFGGSNLLILTSRGVITLGDLLPDPFGPTDVPGGPS